VKLRIANKIMALSWAELDRVRSTTLDRACYRHNRATFAAMKRERRERYFAAGMVSPCPGCGHTASSHDGGAHGEWWCVPGCMCTGVLP
jgi:hypothetical protein